ncbi:MAG TPA: STAS domain-containing protein [Thermoanaerobaculia bacterium]|nr:STAS domain-containing protein [Thermoanaerobaculia bacterium]
MEIVEEREGDVLVLAPVGRLDTTTSRDFEKRMLELVNGGNVHYVIDFVRLDYVSSAGLRVLVMLGKRLPGLSGSLVLSSLSPQVREVFDIAGFTRIFNIVADRKHALAETERQRLGASTKPAKAKPKAAPVPPAKEPAKEAVAPKPTAPAAKPRVAAPAPATPAKKPAAKQQPPTDAPSAVGPAAEPEKPRRSSVEELAIELLRKGEAPPFLEQKKKSK